MDALAIRSARTKCGSACAQESESLWGQAVHLIPSFLSTSKIAGVSLTQGHPPA